MATKWRSLDFNMNLEKIHQCEVYSMSKSERSRLYTNGIQ
jgi:hypothetical protein